MRKPFIKFPFGVQKAKDKSFVDGDTNEQNDQIADIYRSLRNKVLTLNPREIGLQGHGAADVWGVLIEFGGKGGAATLVAIADSTVSFYFSKGGGIIGAGAHQKIAEAAKVLLHQAPDFVKFCVRVETYPLPHENNVRFYLLTFEGVYSAEASQDECGNNQNALSPLFHLADKVVTEIRMMDEERQRKAEQ